MAAAGIAVIQFLTNWFADTPGTAVPYALGALGLIICERSGVLNLTAEGLMLIGALAGIGAYVTMGGHPGIALVVAMASASVVSLLFAGLVVGLRVNQVIAGLSIVFFCQGLTGLLGTITHWQNQRIDGLHPLVIWPFSEIPVIGKIFFMQDAVVYVTVPIFFIVNWWLFSTMMGLRIRSVGENPAAADAAGISVSLHRTLAIVIGSSLLGLAGAYISVVSVKLWVTGMTGGRGWIAVALVVFARWKPWPALGGALLFGCIEAVIPHIAAAGIRVPQYLVMMTPYLATIAVMIWVGATQNLGTSEPGALGQPHVREERR
jgi:simple sugar transport system permease protein